MKTFKSMTDRLVSLAHNPGAMQNEVMGLLSHLSGDEDILLSNPSDPVAYLAEMAVLLGHSTIEANRLELPKQYPILSSSPMELYKHMSDKDYIDVFAQPSSANMILFLDKQDLIDKAVPIDDKGNKKLVLPRDSEVTVAGYTFTLQYPIEFRVLSYGAIQVVWDTSIASPIAGVESDALDWYITRTPGTERDLLRITVPMLQYAIKTYADVITPQLGWSNTYTYTDLFFCARVWMQVQGKWVELKQTHANDVYDVNDPTAVLRLDGNRLHVSIPEIYINTGQVSGNIRVDIYETLGALSVNLGNYAVDDFAMTSKDLGSEVDPKFYTPISKLSLVQTIAEGSTIGGRRQLNFEELRDRVISNSVGVRRLPITEKQLTAAASNLGMEISKPIDYVTGRIFNASVPMLESTLQNVSSSIGTVSLPFDFTTAELESLPTVRSNGLRHTITPDTIYDIAGSKLAINVDLTNNWKFLRAQDLVNIANSNAYFYTPFYYVVDTNSNTLSVRPYDLSTPEVVSKRFVEINDTARIEVVTDRYTLTQDERGYVLTVVTRSEKSYKELTNDQCFAQLSFTPRGHVDEYAHLNGTLIGTIENERVWEFVIGNNLDIDRNDDLITSTFTLVGDDPGEVPMPLTTEFNLFYGTVDYYPLDYRRSTMDNIIKAPSRDALGVTYEKITISFGSALNALWSKSRAITSSIEYEHHPEDVPYLYTEDIKKTDENGVAVYTVSGAGADIDIRFEYLHRKGDPVLDANGDPKIRYYRGDVVLDEAGNPVIKNARSIKYRSEMSVFDARYLFANTDEVISYRDAIREQVVDIVTTTVPAFGAELLEQTEIYFRPTTTISNIEIRRDDGSTDFIPAEQQFTLRYYLTAASRANGDLLATIHSTTRQTVSDWLLEHKTVSVSDITQKLKEELGESIISVEMEKMGPESDIRMFTVLSEASNAGLAKKLSVEADGSIGLRDDIIISYTRHDQ